MNAPCATKHAEKIQQMSGMQPILFPTGGQQCFQHGELKLDGLQTSSVVVHGCGTTLLAACNAPFASLPGSRSLEPPQAQQAQPAGHAHAPKEGQLQYIVEEPDSPVVEHQPHASAVPMQRPLNSCMLYKCKAQNSARAACISGANTESGQRRAAHIMMRRVECKTKSNGKTMSPRLRVREVHQTIDPSGEFQTCCTERWVLTCNGISVLQTDPPGA
jgi:hypothetical protein